MFLARVRKRVQSVMTDQNMRARVRYVIGPDGSPLTIADLPPSNTKRWVIRRKAEVVAAVRGGLLSLDDVEHCIELVLAVIPQLDRKTVESFTAI